VAGMVDTRANAARVAAAKHLLDRYLRRPLLIEPVRRRALVRARRPAA
jgi:hypothetical protein